MVEIELQHANVSGRLEQATQAVERVTLPGVPHSGNNQLAFSDSWSENEGILQQLLSAYQAAVRKNIADTQANVDLLKRQDEVIR
ncbi:MAG: DUF5344 family protein [Sporolactobacillus sp.]